MYKVGIVGMGKMGRIHAEWIKGHEQLELVCLCESNPERREELRALYGLDVYEHYDEFLGADTDMVVVVTTNPSHEPLTVRALDAGKIVVVEKPMSMSAESAGRMIAAAKRNNGKILVHQSSRWDRDYLLLKETIESGKLGDILCIQSKVMLCDEGWAGWGIDGMANPWRTKAEFGGGMLFDWGSHLVDQMMQLMNGRPKSVYGKLQSAVWSKEVDDYTFAMLDFGCGTVCQIEISNNALMEMPRWYVIGTKGAYVVPGRKEPVWECAYIQYAGDDGKPRRDTVEFIGVMESGAEGGFYQELIDHIEGRNDAFVTMEQACDVVRVLEAVQASSSTGQVVKIDDWGDC